MSENTVSQVLTWLGIGTGAILIGTALGFGVYWLWRRARQVLWVLLALLVVAGLTWLFEFDLPRRYPDVTAGLPGVFEAFIWTWILLFTLLALGSLVVLGRMLWRVRHGSRSSGSETRFADIDAAWEGILLALGEARINPAEQRFIVMLAPSPQEIEALVHSAGLRLYAEAPPRGAALRAYAMAEAVLLDASSASAFGCQDAEGGERLAHLAKLLRELDPDRPVVRGVVVTFPAAWAEQPDAPQRAAAVREDLQALRTTLKVRPPIFAILGRVEEIIGLGDFLARMPEQNLLSRSGFAIPSNIAYSGELIGRGLAWFASWFESWGLQLIQTRFLDTAGNGRIVLLIDEVRRRQRRWREVMEAAFSTHRGAEPVPLRGLYAVASGSRPGEQAFAAGLLRGAFSRIPADTITTDWAGEAYNDDRTYQRAAWAVGVVGGLLALATWVYVLREHGGLWWVAFLGVIVAWIVVITRMTIASRSA